MFLGAYPVRQFVLYALLRQYAAHVQRGSTTVLRQLSASLRAKVSSTLITQPGAAKAVP